MRQIKKFCFRPFSEINNLMKQNPEEVVKSNQSMFTALSYSSMALMLFMTLMKIFTPGKIMLCFAYLIVFVVLGAMYLFFMKVCPKYITIGIYLLGAIFFALDLYLSVARAPTERATALLGTFCLAPMCIIDRPIRLNSFMLSFLALSSVLTAIFKNEVKGLAVIDIENCICFTFLGLFFGALVSLAKLRSFDAQRRLVVEKTTDSLTGLFNRRKLFERIGRIHEGAAERPDCVLMMDLDHFKEYNDRFGHLSGDEYLRRFGEMLVAFSKTEQSSFFRYGGEEFVGFIYHADSERALALANSICESTRKLDSGEANMTVSIGAVICDDAEVASYEKWIERADAATYQAKKDGRDRVVLYK